MCACRYTAVVLVHASDYAWLEHEFFRYAVEPHFSSVCACAAHIYASPPTSLLRLKLGVNEIVPGSWERSVPNTPECAIFNVTVFLIGYKHVSDHL